MSEKKSNKPDDRVRNWTFCIYPESAPADWKEIINSWLTPWVLSPLHDKDLNADNSPKKAHFHVLMMFSGKKSYSQIKELTDMLNAPRPEEAKNTKGLVRYFAHVDNPEKAQYPMHEITGYCGADLEEMLKVTGSAKLAVLKEVLKWIDENDIKEFYQVLQEAMYVREDWFPILANNYSVLLQGYIKSKRYSKKYPNIDSETGEIIE